MFFPQRQLFFAEKIRTAELTSTARSETSAEALARKQQECAAAHAHVEARLATLGSGQTNRDIINLCYRAAAHRLAGGGALPSLTTDQRVADLAYRIGRDLGIPLDDLIKQGRDQPFQAQRLGVATAPSPVRSLAKLPEPVVQPLPEKVAALQARPAEPQTSTVLPHPAVAAPIEPQPPVTPIRAPLRTLPAVGTVTTLRTALASPSPPFVLREPPPAPSPQRAPPAQAAFSPRPDASLRAASLPPAPPFTADLTENIPRIPDFQRSQVNLVLSGLGLRAHLGLTSLVLGGLDDALPADTQAVTAKRFGDLLTITLARASGTDLYAVDVPRRTATRTRQGIEEPPRSLDDKKPAPSWGALVDAADRGALPTFMVDLGSVSGLDLFRAFPELMHRLSRSHPVYETTALTDTANTLSGRIFMHPESSSHSLAAGNERYGWRTTPQATRRGIVANETSGYAFGLLQQLAWQHGYSLQDTDTQVYRGLDLGVPGLPPITVLQANECISDYCSMREDPADIFRVMQWDPVQADAERPGYSLTARLMRHAFERMLRTKGSSQAVRGFMDNLAAHIVQPDAAIGLFHLRPSDMTPIVETYREVSTRLLSHLSKQAGIPYAPPQPLTS